MHGVDASAMEAGGTQEVWTVPEPGAFWEFCFGKEDGFHFFHYIFGKFFPVFDGLYTAGKNSPLHCGI